MALLFPWRVSPRGVGLLVLSKGIGPAANTQMRVRVGRGTEMYGTAHQVKYGTWPVEPEQS